MAETAAKPAVAERRKSSDRRKSGVGRRNSDQAFDVQDQRSAEAVVAITAAIILAPRLQALELRDTLPMRNLIQQSVSLAKLILQKTEVELARDASEKSSR